jgi:WD40 repeat protein
MRVAQTIPFPTGQKSGPGFPSALSFSPDSAAVLVGWRVTGGGYLTRDEIATQKRTYGFKPLQKGFIHSAIELRNGCLLAAGESGEIVLLNRDLTALRSFVGHRGPVNSAAVSPDERRLVTTGNDGTVRLWDIETGLELFQLGKHTKTGTGVAFSPDGTRIASTDRDGTLRIWSAVRPPVAPPPRSVGP